MPRRRSPQLRALLSGQAGVVVLLNGSTCLFRRVGEVELQPCRPDDISYLFGDATDVISVVGKSMEQAFRILESEWTHDRALHLTLILLDRDAHLRAKRVAAEALEELVAVPPTRQFVLHRLYAWPLPASADVADALEFCRDTRSKVLWGMLVTLREDQPQIRTVRDRWDLLDLQLFGTARGKHLFERMAVAEGMFFSLCHRGDRVFGDLIPQWLNNPSLREFASCKQVLETWAGAFIHFTKSPASVAQLDLFDVRALR